MGFLECLGVDTQPSDMSFALSLDGGKLEWGSDNLDTIFAQRSNLASPSFMGMLRDVVRFGKEAPKVCGAVWRPGRLGRRWRGLVAGRGRGQRWR